MKASKRVEWLRMMEHERKMQQSARDLFPRVKGAITTTCRGCGIEFDWAPRTEGTVGGRPRMYCTSECKSRYGSSRPRSHHG